MKVVRNKNKIINKYLWTRMLRPNVPFSSSDSKMIKDLCVGVYNPKSENINFYPVDDFHIKPVSDKWAIRLWNEVFESHFHISTISDVKLSASSYVKYADKKFPFGDGMKEIDYVRYVQASASSSYIGIQKPKRSRFALNSMISTIESHSNPTIVEKPWVIDNLKDVIDRVNRDRLMDFKYSDVIMSAKTSSSSIRDEGSFRDYVLSNTLEDVVGQLHEVPYWIYMGTRSDRRGKFRLICSFDARFRIIDYLLNHGVYPLFERRGLLSQYTTEGYSNSEMWRELVSMSDRSFGKTLVCIDYKGYDTQLSLDEYLELCLKLNKYRSNCPLYGPIIDWYKQWMEQPKPLIVRSTDGVDIVIACYVTLASGLHGTHSHENWFGVATYREALKRGIKGYRFWSNGDDQNALINRSSIDDYISFLNKYYNISWDKSLVGHSLGVWGKLWFATDFHPMWEMGTIRSIWEKEGGDVNSVEESKFQSNFCKIVQVAITLIRVGKSESQVRSLIEELCEEVGVESDRIPVRLNELSYKQSKVPVGLSLDGLKSVKNDLMARSFRFKALNANNYYDMLEHMAKNKVFFSLEPMEIKYYDKGTMLHIGRSLRFDDMVPNDVPWVYRRLYSGSTYLGRDLLVRDILQGTKSYDGPSSLELRFNDIYTLAYSVNVRNRVMWNRLMTR